METLILLRSDDYTNSTSKDDDVPNSINDDGMEILPPRNEEVQVAILRLKNNKAAGSDGLHAELLNTIGNELVGACTSIFTKNGWRKVCSTIATSVFSALPRKGENPKYAPTTGV